MSEIHILTHEFRPKRGGAGVVCEKIAHTLSLTGHNVTVWAPEYVSTEKGELPDFEIRAIAGLRGTRNLGCLLATAKEILRNRNGLENATMYLGDPGPIAVFFYLTLFYRPFWKRLIITLHGSEIERYRKNPVSSWLFKRLLRRVETVHVLSTYNRDKLLNWIPCIKDKLKMGYGMMVPQENLPVLRSAAERDDGSRIRLLCVGRIHPRKGQLPLLKAVSQLSIDLQQQLEVCFAGQLVKGWYFDKLKKAAKSCRAEINFLGGLSDEVLAQAYGQADIFALTSMPYRASVEGLGLVYLEASRYALPIIAHDIGGVCDVVVNGENGYLIDWKDQKALIDRLGILIANPAICKQLGEVGRSKVENCSWESVTRQLFE